MGRRRSKNYGRRRRRGPKVRANERIKYPEVRIIDDDSGENLGVFPIEKAREMAKEAGKDLVEVTEKAKPPVVKIIDLGKFLYRQSKKEKKQKSKQKTQELKSIRIKLNTSDHDKEIKAKKIDEFLEEGNPVEARIFLRGREKANKGFAKKRLQEFLDLISVPYRVTMEPKYVGNGFATQIIKDADNDDE